MGSECGATSKETGLPSTNTTITDKYDLPATTSQMIESPLELESKSDEVTSDCDELQGITAARTSPTCVDTQAIQITHTKIVLANPWNQPKH